MAKKKLFSEIVVILDKSGSMHGIQTDTIGGYNQFLNEQKKVGGKANITLVQFDTSYNFTYKGVDIKEALELNDKTYIPSGMTALLDAVGRGIIETEKRIVDMKKKPDQVVFMIITDGHENSSREFTQAQIAKMVKDKQDVDKWDFVFLGAGIDSFEQGGNMGFGIDTTSNYDKGNIQGAMKKMSDKMSVYRSTGLVSSLNFTDDDRNELTDDDKS